MRGAGGKVLADIVSLVRFALHQENELRPFHDQVNERFAQWMAQQEKNDRRFTQEQRQWLERDLIAGSAAHGNAQRIIAQADELQAIIFGAQVQRAGIGVAQRQGLPQDVIDHLIEVLLSLQRHPDGDHP